MQLWLIIIRLALCLAVFHTSFSCLQPYQLGNDFAISPKKRSGWQTEGEDRGRCNIGVGHLLRSPAISRKGCGRSPFSKRYLCWRKKKNNTCFSFSLLIQIVLSSLLLGAEVFGSHKPTGKFNPFQCRPGPVVHLSAWWCAQKAILICFKNRSIVYSRLSGRDCLADFPLGKVFLCLI